MPRTLLAAFTPVGPHPVSVAAGALLPTFTAYDAANKNEFLCTGRELLLIKNAHASLAKTVTILTAADPQGRKNDITAYSIAAGATALFWFGSIVGWDSGSGKVWLDAEDNNIQFCVVRPSTL